MPSSLKDWAARPGPKTDDVMQSWVECCACCIAWLEEGQDKYLSPIAVLLGNALASLPRLPPEESEAETAQRLRRWARETDSEDD